MGFNKQHINVDMLEAVKLDTCKDLSNSDHEQIAMASPKQQVLWTISDMQWVVPNTKMVHGRTTGEPATRLMFTDSHEQQRFICLTRTYKHKMLKLCQK